MKFMKKYILQRGLRLPVGFIMLLVFISISEPGYGDTLKIKGITVYPSVPEPGQEVILRLDLEGLSSGNNKIRLIDVFDREIATKEILFDFPFRGYIDIPFTAPVYKGRYNYNIRVSMGDENRFINIPVSSEPVTSAVIENLNARFEDDKLIISFQVKNNGNQILKGFKVSGIINPKIGMFSGKDIPEVLVNEEFIEFFERDSTVNIEFYKMMKDVKWLYGTEQDTFWLGINISDIGEKQARKIEKYRIKDSRPIIVPLHSLPAHTFYTEQAIDVFPADSSLYQELNLYRQQLIDGSYNEDYSPDLVYDEIWPFLYIHHFMDYDNHPFYSGLYGTGLHIPLITSNYVESAYEKAMSYWEGWTLNSEYHPGVIELYLGVGLPYPDKITAYEYLGRIAHLIEDMLTPAHVHSDVHGIIIDDDEFEEIFEPGTDPDTGRPRYEKYDENSAVWAYWRAYIGNRNIQDLAELFTKINNHTDYFPSDEAEGDSNNFSNPWNIPKLYKNDIIYYDIFGLDHYKLPGMQYLADWVSPLNVMSVASIYKLFWDTIY